MSHQPEAILEDNMIRQLVGQGYGHVHIHDEDSLLSNQKSCLEDFNNTTFSQKEFGAILNHLAKGNVFEKAKTLHDRFQLNRDNGDSFYVRFFNNDLKKKHIVMPLPFLILTKTLSIIDEVNSGKPDRQTHNMGHYLNMLMQM